MSGAGKHADRTSLASAGGNIYTAYVTQENYEIDPATPREAFFRRFVKGSGWQAAQSLTSASGRVDYPILSASGTNVFVAYTNSDTGDVVVRRSTNSGGSFAAPTTLGETTRDDGEGLAGWPISCANGSTSAIVWLPGDGTITLSVSENSGTSYTNVSIPAVNAGDDDEGWASCDASGNRVGITWNETDGVYYAEYSTGTDSFTTARKNIYPFSGSGYAASYSGTVALTGASKVGIAAPLCVQDGCDYDGERNSDRSEVARVNEPGRQRSVRPRRCPMPPRPSRVARR